eukprot:5524185-Alexandrium_andersonii.AAC.1
MMTVAATWARQRSMCRSASLRQAAAPMKVERLGLHACERPRRRTCDTCPRNATTTNRRQRIS